MNKGPYAALIEWFARNAVAANLLMAILLAGGIYTVFTIKKEIQPRIETNFISIQVPFLGATPSDAEEGVVIKIEEAIQDIEGIEEIISTAGRGFGRVQVEVNADYEVAEVMDEVKNRVDAISTFPENTEKPTISRTQFQQQVVMVTVYGDVSERTLKEYAKQVRNEIVTLPGVTRAEILGSRPYEVSIEISEFTLQGYDLTLTEVARAVRAGSLDLSAGAIRSDSGDILLRTKGQAYVGRDFEDIVARTNPDGTRILLKDIAHIRDAFVETDRFAEYNGKPSITIQVLSVGDQSELDISATVHDYVTGKKANLPKQINMDAWADVSYYLKGRLDMMIKNLVLGAVLVFLILALFLRFKLAIWVTIGIPISFLGSFILLPLFGVSLNMMSLFAFIVTLGMVVDDAIVVGENAFRHYREGKSRLAAAIAGAREMAMPVTFSIATTVCAFAPLLCSRASTLNSPSCAP